MTFRFSPERMDMGALKPERLSILGTVLRVDDENVFRITKKEAAILTILIERWGKVVSKESLHQLIYGEQVDGGPGAKIFGIYMHKIRLKLAGTKIDIFTHWNTGWQLGVRKYEERAP